MGNPSAPSTNPRGSDAPYPHFTVEKTKAKKLADFSCHLSQECGPAGLECHYFTDKVYLWSQTELRM